MAPQTTEQTTEPSTRRRRVSIPVEFAVVLVGVLFLFVIVTDLGVTWRDDTTLDRATASAAHAAASSKGTLRCGHPASEGLDAPTLRTICRVQHAFGDDLIVRVRIAQVPTARSGTRLVVCAMSPVRSVTGALRSFATGRAHLARASVAGTDAPVAQVSEPALAGQSWSFCDPGGSTSGDS
jgi:Putative Flp pilus-assembly TadE/G-like